MTPCPTAILDSMQAIADDDAAGIVSISYGIDDADLGLAAAQAEDQVLLQMELQGQAVFASAGDDGAYGDSGQGLNVEDPGSQPLVTSVGGTTLFTQGTSQSYLAEIVWDELGNGLGATGGGVSSFWNLPSYQSIFRSD